jgi:hypothetical protein
LAQVELETATHDEAWRLAAGTVVPLVLDALSFAAGAPMLLRDCELTLKSEAGNRTRRGVYVRQLRYPNALFADEEVLNAAQQILNTDGPRLPLCWLRYSHQRELALEKYVFAWLGLEELAGDADIEKECPNCGNRVTYRSDNRQRGWELFQAANPETERREFDRDICGRARNSVFHGSVYPNPDFLVSLMGITGRTQRAVSQQLAAGFNLERAPEWGARAEQLFRMNLFFAWETAHPEDEFASDWSHDELRRIAEGYEPGRVDIVRDPNLRLLEQNDFAGW